MTRLGLIGAGRWGKNIIRTLESFPGAKLARIAGRQDWQQAAHARDLDGLIIATPPASHFEIAQTAVEAGLPVLVEKPVTMEPGQARALLDLAQRRRVLVMVDQLFLFHPAYTALKEKARELGPIKSISSWGGNWGPFRQDVSPLWDYAPHDIYLCLDLLEARPSSVHAQLKASREVEGGRGENWLLQLDFKSGAGAELHSNNLSDKKQRRLEVYFETQALVFDDQAGAKLVLHELKGGALGPGQALKTDSNAPLNAVLRTFIESIQTGNRDLSGLRLAVD